MKLIQDLREFIGLLNSANVRYLVIGGWAYNRYAEPRFTGDIDFFVAADSKTETALRRVLVDFGFGHELPPPGQPLFDKRVIMLGRPPHRIDLITEISGVTFEEAWDGRVEGELDGLPVGFISLAHLLQNKKAAGRDKDVADVATLQRLLDE